jgi:hypothetical protein
MSLISDFYVAPPEQAARYDTDRTSVPDFERVEFKGLTCDECANLWAILQQSEPTPEHQDAFESVLVVDGGQRLINRFPGDFVTRLAALDDSSSATAAEKWIQTGELAYMSCEASDVLPIIEALSRLARSAEQSGRALYLWMCI